MRMSQHPAYLTAWALALASGCSTASALGFGAATSSALIGSPLDFSVSLELAPGERITPDCLAADVAMGTALLPPSAVSVGVQALPGGLRVRVMSRAPVTEPIVGVVVSVGCPARITRRFTVLADPPAMAASTPAVPPEVATAPPLISLPSRSQSSAPAEPRPRLRVEAPTVQSAGVAAPTPGPAASSASLPAPQPPLQAQAAAEAAEAAEAAASAARARVLALETNLLALRVESRQQRDALARLEVELARAREQALIGWAAGGLALLLGLAAAALGWRRRREPRPATGRWRWSFAPRGGAQAEPGWGAIEPAAAAEPAGAGRRLPDTAVQGLGGVAVPAAVGVQSLALPSMTMEAVAPADPEGPEAPDERPADGESERTRLMAPAELAASEPLPTVSAEESLELEQQVEFLTVLGQEDAAANLLMEHLRKTGGTFPMPFLKLMDIHRRRGDRAAYEAVRARFNQRFNAVAAAFGAASLPTRGLQEHPEMMRRIERAWADPVESMTLLENLIFRSDGEQPLDLTALEDVVFLHAVARDVRRHSGERITEVDVLLSLEEHGSDILVAVPEALPPAGRGAAQPGAAAESTPSTPADTWPSIDESRFDVGGLQLEPVRARSDMAAGPGTGG
jgi:pilus assembly protein FimV